MAECRADKQRRFRSSATALHTGARLQKNERLILKHLYLHPFPLFVLPVGRGSDVKTRQHITAALECGNEGETAARRSCVRNTERKVRI